MPDDDPKDWEPIEEETLPERLSRKWEEQESLGPQTISCPVCAQPIPTESATCLFCSALIGHDSGLLGKILLWLKSIFK